MIERVLYWLVVALVRLLQSLPLSIVARLGRWGGALAYGVDGRHRKVAIRNLTNCFGNEKTPGEIKAIAIENFKRIGENYACAVKTAGMSFEELSRHVD